MEQELKHPPVQTSALEGVTAPQRRWEPPVYIDRSTRRSINQRAWELRDIACVRYIEAMILAIREGELEIQDIAAWSPEAERMKVQ
jgi:hypothetical protein